ncbi:MAG: xanthine dehydrogenase family protein molybdopterin-binding subunit [Candidatus Tectomicrobia bacterium]|nr:xanthine dehydrogenase family protein molybdopterin-binding subunit [Candidatus Tectomicrobia bacterium]
MIGKPLPQRNAPEKVRGAALYLADLVFPRLLIGKVLRSPHAHARIHHASAEKAKRVPGVRAVITGEDVPATPWGPLHKERHVLAREKVRFIGEEVAAVAAETEDAALEALSLIQVDYEELPAVFDPEEAMLPGAPEIHPGGRNLAREIHIRRGDVEEGFRRAAFIHQARYETPVQYQAYMEPLGALAQVDPSGRLTIWAPTQTLFLTRQAVAEALDLPLSRIRVVQTTVGGAFGGKVADTCTYQIAALLAMKSRRPVRLAFSRLEDFQAAHPRMAARIELKMGMSADGRLTAKETRIVANSGAYAGLATEIVLVTAFRPDNLYRLGNLSTTTFLAYTNNVPAGAFRGFGNPQMTFALESHIDALARLAGLDPVEVRLRNLVHAGDVTAHGWRIESCGLRECLEKVSKAVGWADSGGRAGSGAVRRGVGVACAVHVSGARQIGNWDGSSVAVKVNEDGRVHIVCGEGDIGQGAETMLAQVASEELRIPIEDVVLTAADTDSTPFCFGGFASRLTMLAGNALRRAIGDARRQLLDAAAEKLEAAPQDLLLEGGRVFVKGASDRGIALGEACRAHIYRRGGGGIFASATYDSDTTLPDPETHYGNISAAYSFAAQAAEVEVDVETGSVRIVRLVAADDLGRALNPLTCEGQIQGAVVQGVGFSFFECSVIEKGVVVNGNLADYTLPKAAGLPEISSILVESMDPNGPYGAKGVSECSIVPTAAAIANAIEDAVGIRLTKLPIRPEDVLWALRREGVGPPQRLAAGEE